MRNGEPLTAIKLPLAASMAKPEIVPSPEFAVYKNFPPECSVILIGASPVANGALPFCVSPPVV